MLRTVALIGLLASPVASQEAELDLDSVSCVGLMMAAQTPEFLVPEVRAYLAGLRDGIGVAAAVLGEWNVQRVYEICALDPSQTAERAIVQFYIERADALAAAAEEPAP